MDFGIHKLVNWMIDQTIISEEQREVIFFGVRQGIIYVINILTFLAIGIMTSNYWGVLIYILTYMILRSYAGGYHAETEIGCYISSAMMVLVVMLLMNAVTLTTMADLVILLGSSLFVIMLGPVEDHNKPLDDLERQIYRKRMIVILILELLGILLAIMLQYEEAVAAATYGLASVGMVVVLGWVKNQLRRRSA